MKTVRITMPLVSICVFGSLPVPMAKAFHQALRGAGVETELVIYPNESHGIRQPRHRASHAIALITP